MAFVTQTSYFHSALKIIFDDSVKCTLHQMPVN